MNSTHPTNLIVHTAQQRTLVPWHWFLRARADKSTSTIVLVFSGLKIDVTTVEPFKLLEAIHGGTVSRIRLAPVKEPSEGDFIVDAISFRDEEDDEE